MLTGAIIGLIVGLIGAVALMAKQSKAKQKIKADLQARGVATVPGIGALQIRQNLLIAGGARTPEWSALVPGQPAVQLYQHGGIVVVGWASAAAGVRPGTLVVTGPDGSNPDKTKLQEIPKKQHGQKGVRLFASAGPAAEWGQRSGVAALFIQRFGKERAWHFAYAEGSAYLYSYQSIFAGLDDVIRTVGQFEQALISG